MTCLVCGIDEAGRGPLAGPVLAAAVILPADFPADILNDSKKLSEKKRLMAEQVIKAKALWGIGSASPAEIDEINILRASLLAMKRAFEAMFRQGRAGGPPADITALVDGLYCPDISVPCRAVPKADGLFPPVMAASILAKCERDRIMTAYAALYPAYGYEKHKGYPTAAHREICRRIGPSPVQRMSFAYHSSMFRNA
ncbi:MAG: ribonuclease HII [Treponema sp.]|jgi:ribonuclease HII|nr:ribonuclease HII [Treponema sp.]